MHTHMIYINEDNIIISCDAFYTHKHVVNNTGYLPLHVHGNTLLLSDRRLYKIHDDKLSILYLKQKNYYAIDYVIDSADFTDKFAKINSEHYDIYGIWLLKNPAIANNSYNIKRILCEHYEYKYYYVNVNNELAVFGELHKSEKHTILDNNVSSILYRNYQSDDHCIIYMKNNAIIYSRISNFTQLTDHYVIDYVGQSIIKSSDDFLLDSRNDLYQFIKDNKKVITKKISDSVVDFYCDSTCTYITDTENRIYCIDKNNYSRKYIGVGHFGRSLRNTKSANNTYNKIYE